MATQILVMVALVILLIDLDMIRDTTVDAREIEVRLKDASTMMKKNTVFLSVRCPQPTVRFWKQR